MNIVKKYLSNAFSVGRIFVFIPTSLFFIYFFITLHIYLLIWQVMFC